MKIFRYLKSLPLQIALAVLIGIVLHPFLDILIVQFSYSFSVALKDILMLALPILIFFYLAASLSSFKNVAPLMVVGLFALVACSNALSVLTAYVVGSWTLGAICGTQVIALTNATEPLPLLFSFPLRPFIQNEWALFAGITTGLIATRIPSQYQIPLIGFINSGRECATRVLRTVFLPVLPLYVLGFAMKFMHDGSLFMLLKSYSKVFLLSSSLVVIYITFLYWVGAGFSASKAGRAIKNMLPAGLAGFSTMSSAIAMPVTLAATEKNMKGDTTYTQFVVPATANIHMMGDGISITLTALSLLYMSQCGLPSFETYLLFTFYYCIAKFSAAGVPAGGVIVVLPVVEKYLGLSPDLTTLVATIYIMQDTFATGSNVMGNGAFAMITQKIFKQIGWHKPDVTDSSPR